ncbi:MAG: hypothetical protein ACRCTY_06595, partial [Candidatus Adiutrix sp.]
MSKTLRANLLIAVVFSVLASLLFMGIFLNNSASRYLIDKKYDELSVIVDFLAISAKKNKTVESMISDFNGLAQTINKSQDYHLSLVGDNGQLWADSFLFDELKETVDIRINRPEVALALANKENDGQVRLSRYSTTLGRDFLYVAAPITIDDENIFVLRVGAPLYPITKLKNKILHIYIIVSTLSLIFIFLVCYLLLRPIDNDIKRLIDMTKTLANGNLKQRMLRLPPNELGTMGAYLNRLASGFMRQNQKYENHKKRLDGLLSLMDEGV